MPPRHYNSESGQAGLWLTTLSDSNFCGLHQGWDPPVSFIRSFTWVCWSNVMRDAAQQSLKNVLMLPWCQCCWANFKAREQRKILFSYLRSWEGLLNKCHVIICNYIPLVLSMIYALPNDLRIISVSSKLPPMFSPCFIFNPLQIPLPFLPHHLHPTDPHAKSGAALVGLCTCTKKRKTDPS